METLSIGSKGDQVKELQKRLNLVADGNFGKDTKAAVSKFQLANNIHVDGVVGNETWVVLLSIKLVNENIDLDSDIQDQYSNTSYDQTIRKYHLPKGQFISGVIKNEYIFLHHTAGSDNPYAVIDSWGRDNRGEIGTEFVLGGQSHINGATTHDGILLQAFPTGAQGWHLGNTNSGYMNRHSVGMEMCSMGYLDNDLKTYVNSQCIKTQVCTLKESFRGRIHWHNYSDKQISELEKWIKFVANRDSIDMRAGLVYWIKKLGPLKAFDFQEDACAGKVKGLLTHTNVRKDKMDCYPHPGLIDMLVSL